MYMIYIRYMYRKIQFWVLDCKINVLIDYIIIIIVYIRFNIFFKNNFKKKEMKKKYKLNIQYYVIVL